MLWIKAFHIISIVCWFAGLFYLPRLFVYHSQSEDTISLERFKVMEHKLYHYIMTPSAIASLVFGLWLLSYNISGYLAMGWVHAKLSLVLLLFIYHVWCGYHLKQFAQDKNQKGHVYYRYFNELPSILLVAIVILAVVKPF